MNNLKLKVITAAFILINIFSLAITSHATYSYLDNTGKLDNLSVDHNK